VTYAINWGLLGEPVNVGAAVEAGFERGATRSALADLSTDPTNEGALSRLAMFQPEQAVRYQDRARQHQYRSAVRGALTPSGGIDQTALGRAVAEHGEPSDVISFQATRARTAESERETADANLERLAGLAEQANAENWPQVRAAATEIDPTLAARIPEQFDPEWVARQRIMIGVLRDRPRMTSLMQNVEAAGYNLSTPEGQAYLRQRLEEQTPRIVMVNGQPMLVGGGDTGSAAAPELSDDDVRRFDEGGPAPAAGPATFPGN
jgi:hypothetical protein